MAECICCHEEKYHKIELKEGINEFGYKYYFKRKTCRACVGWISDEKICP